MESARVTETFQGKTVWDGTVEVFDLIGHPTAKRAYAWAHETDQGKTRYVAVLHEGPVDSPQNAVKAAIISEQRESMKKQMPFPEALKKLLDLREDADESLVAYLNAGWNGLSVRERELLAERLSREPDTMERIRMAVVGVIRGVYH